MGTAGRGRPEPKSALVSAQMSRMPRSSTRPELALRRALHARGLRYRVHRRDLPGTPDIVLSRARVAVFVDGCFWHGCASHCAVPKNNREWWVAKLVGNAERDRRKDRDLEQLGWLPLHLWEHTPVDEMVEQVLSAWRQRTGRERGTPPDWRPPSNIGDRMTTTLDGVQQPAKGQYGVTLVRGPFVRLPPHPLAVTDESSLRELVAGLEGPLAADLFCGAGGLSHGLTGAGFTVVLGVDIDGEALATHRAHHPGLSTKLDLGDPEIVENVAHLVRDLGVSLVAGGPPCQPFSSAGRSALRDLVRRGARSSRDSRRDLWQSFLRIVSVARPPAVLMENVPEMALDRGMWILRTMVDELEEMGYSVEERLVATADYGVPQMRQRLILVALADGARFEWPAPTTTVSLRAAIGDLPEVEGGWRPANGDDPLDPVASGWTPYGGPATEFQRRMRAAMPAEQADRIYDHITRPVREDDLRAFEQMDPSTRYSDIDPELRRYRDDIFDDKYKRLDWSGLSRTITAHIAKDGYWYIHPEQNRTLTVREAARIQTFPDWFRFSGPPSAAFRQIGNAVPCLLGEELGGAIIGALGRALPEPRTTREIAHRLAEWFLGRDTPSVPWLRATNRWQVIAAELLWARLPRETIDEAWSATRNFARPEDLLDASVVSALLRYARSARARGPGPCRARGRCLVPGPSRGPARRSRVAPTGTRGRSRGRRPRGQGVSG